MFPSPINPTGVFEAMDRVDTDEKKKKKYIFKNGGTMGDILFC